MSSLKHYESTNAAGFTTTFKLSDVDAKRRGLEGKHIDPDKKPATRTRTTQKRGTTPRNKQATTPANKADAPDQDKSETAPDADETTEADTAADDAARIGFGEAFENKS